MNFGRSEELWFLGNDPSKCSTCFFAFSLTGNIILWLRVYLILRNFPFWLFSQNSSPICRLLRLVQEVLWVKTCLWSIILSKFFVALFLLWTCKSEWCLKCFLNDYFLWDLLCEGTIFGFECTCVPMSVYS